MSQPGWFQIDAHVAVARGTAPVGVRFGTARIGELGHYLASRGRRRILVVTGPHVGADSGVMDPVREALGGMHFEEFLEASPGKHISTLFRGIQRLEGSGTDAIVGIGGGGSLDTARQMAAFLADGRTMSAHQGLARAGTVPTFDVTDHVDVVLVPTTLAGADLSVGGSIEVLSASESADGLPKRVNPGAVAPSTVFYDPDLYRSTPYELLAGSAMNGFNKGIETVYSPTATPYSDAVAARGITLMTSGLLALRSHPAVALPDVVAGLILVQLQRKISVLHAFGHAVTRHTSLQQGIAHAIVTPYALEMLLSLTDLRRSLLANALRQGGASRDAADDADTVVRGVTAVRDGLGLPATFGKLGLAEGLDLAVLAEHVCAASLMKGSPLGRPLTVEEARSVFEAAL